MSLREVRSTGYDALALCTELLQRVRLTDANAGVWEASDPQWWSRRPRDSDEIEQVFWVDDEGPVAGVYVTTWQNDTWQCDPIVVPGVAEPGLAQVWSTALAQLDAHATGPCEVVVRDDDDALEALAVESGFVAADAFFTASMQAADRPDVQPLPAGFTIVDRSLSAVTPHPMRERNGQDIAERLGRCSLYDPELDLAVRTEDGRIAGYSLYWFDPVTLVGEIEPVRIEDDYQRRGVARAMITVGLDRLAKKGAERFTIGFESEAAGALYRGLGFQLRSSETLYRREGAANVGG